MKVDFRKLFFQNVATIIKGQYGFLEIRVMAIRNTSEYHVE